MIYRYLIITLLIAAIAVALPTAAMAQRPGEVELDPELAELLEGGEEVPHYHFPEIKPEYSALLGYRTTGFTGPRSILRFGEHEDSVLFTGDYRAYAFPHRFYFYYDRESPEVYFGELRYAVGDTVFLRWVGSGLFRNPESVVPVDLDTSTSFPGVSVNDADAEYGIGKNTEDVFLRLKYPDYAAHLFVSA